jgi:hypothetical protein
VGEAKDDLGRLVWDQVEAHAARGDVLHVRDLGMQLADRHAAAAEQVRKYQHQLAHVVRVLAVTPGRDSLVRLLELLEKGPSAAAPVRFVASLLAEHHKVNDLVSTVFDRGEWKQFDELRACLFHELVLRGVDVDAFPPLRSWLIVQPGYHPLAWLPADRRDLEADAEFPHRSINGSAGSGSSMGLPDKGRVDPPTPRTADRSALRDVATADVHETIVAAVEAGEWGACGAWVFMLDDPITAERVPALLPTLPMSCVDGLGPTDRFEVAVRPVDEIWRMLFTTASQGGMYSHGVHGAYGRLWAWKSMAGLSGAPADASAEQVEHCARQSTWFHFEADADWFHNEVGSDYGIAALSPDRRRIAVLAATDTD